MVVVFEYIPDVISEGTFSDNVTIINNFGLGRLKPDAGFL
jgi:hypothetical protein